MHIYDFEAMMSGLSYACSARAHFEGTGCLQVGRLYYGAVACGYCQTLDQHVPVPLLVLQLVIFRPCEDDGMQWHQGCQTW